MREKALNPAKQEIKLISFLNFNIISFFAFFVGERFIVETCCPCIVAG